MPKPFSNGFSAISFDKAKTIKPKPCNFWLLSVGMVFVVLAWFLQSWLWLLLFGFCCLGFGYLVFGTLLVFGFCCLGFGCWKAGFGCCCLVVVLEGWLIDGRLALAFGLWHFGFWLWLLVFGILAFGLWYLAFGFGLVVVLEGWLIDGRLALAFGLWYFGFWLWLLVFGILAFGLWYLAFGFGLVLVFGISAGFYGRLGLALAFGIVVLARATAGGRRIGGLSLMKALSLYWNRSNCSSLPLNGLRTGETPAVV